MPATGRYTEAMRNLTIDNRQLPAVQDFIVCLRPREELIYRLALSGMFAACHHGEWHSRKFELLRQGHRKTGSPLQPTY